MGDILSGLRSGSLKFGLPMWYLKAWEGRWLTAGIGPRYALQEYAGCFSSVEGNTSFYGLPSDRSLNAWKEVVPENFRFVLKLPQTITHARYYPAHKFANAINDHVADLQRLQSSLGEMLGGYMAQFPSTFSSDCYEHLREFLEKFREFNGSIPLAVELRHGAFFDKHVHEPKVLRLLSDYNASRVTFDSRGLQRDHSSSDEVIDARRKKPNMPVHPIATSEVQIVRFIGHSSYPENNRYIHQWKKKVEEWLSSGKRVYFFVHTAGNEDGFEFINYILNEWGLPVIIPAARRNQQALF